MFLEKHYIITANNLFLYPFYVLLWFDSHEKYQKFVEMFVENL